MTPERLRTLHEKAKQGSVKLDGEELGELLTAYEGMQVPQNRIRLDSQIFMGSGWVSLAKIGHAYSLLSRAFDIMGGIQQPRMATEEPDPKDEDLRHTDEIELNKIAQELYLGLTGRKAIK